MATRRRYLLYGVGRNLRHRRHRPRRGLRPCHPYPAAHAASLEPAHRLHDWRAFQRPALRRRLLRVGAPRHGQLLGVSGSMALARSLHLRYGDLPDSICRLPDAYVPLVCGGTSWGDGGFGGSRDLRAAEYCRRAGGFDHVAVALLRPVSPVRAYHCPGTLQVRRAGSCRHHPDHLDRRHYRRPPDRHVELHGVGQCLYHRHRSRAPTAHLSARRADGGRHRLAHLHCAGRRHVDDRAARQRLGDRLLGRHRPHGRRSAAPRGPGSRRNDERLWHV